VCAYKFVRTEYARRYSELIRVNQEAMSLAQNQNMGARGRGTCLILAEEEEEEEEGEAAEKTSAMQSPSKQPTATNSSEIKEKNTQICWEIWENKSER